MKTILNHSQKEMPMLGFIPSMRLVPHELIRNCKHRLDAIRLCIQLSGLTNETICEKLGIDKGHMSRMMQGRANFPDTKSLDLMNVCGNYAPLQFEAWKCGFNLVEQVKDQRIAELEQELQRLRGVA